MAGPDLTTVTAAVDFGTVVVAILFSFAALIVVYIAWKGARMVLAVFRNYGYYGDLDSRD